MSGLAQIMPNLCTAERSICKLQSSAAASYLPQVVRDIAWKAQVRLCSRYRRLAAAGKPKVVVTTAIAREMLGFVWAIAQSVQVAPLRTI